MKTRELLTALMARYGDNPNSLAQKLASQGVRQPQVYKFVTGQTKEPKRSTLLPVAQFYGIPVDAFFSDQSAADFLARLDQGWLPKPLWRNMTGTVNDLPTKASTAAEPTAPNGIAQQTVTVEKAFEVLALHLAGADAVSRKQAAFQLSSLADSPADFKKLADLFVLTTQPSKQRAA